MVNRVLETFETNKIPRISSTRAQGSVASSATPVSHTPVVDLRETQSDNRSVAIQNKVELKKRLYILLISLLVMDIIVIGLNTIGIILSDTAHMLVDSLTQSYISIHVWASFKLLDALVDGTRRIAGRQEVVQEAKLSVAPFKVRENSSIGSVPQSSFSIAS